jgi:hypothetical protein
MFRRPALIGIDLLAKEPVNRSAFALAAARIGAPASL